MSDSYDDYEAKIQLAEYAWEIKDARHTFRKNRIKENKMSRKAMQMALGALEDANDVARMEFSDENYYSEAINALRQALETEQEPVAWISEGGDVSRSKRYMDEMGFKCNPLYTAPKQWVGLTAYEIQEIHSGNQHWGDFACAIEAKLREKNT